MSKKIQLVGFLFVSILFSFCSNKKEQTNETVAYHVENQIITLTADSNLKERIHLSPVAEEIFSFDLVTAGIVKAIPNQYAEISSPYAGRIVKSFVTLGQKVAVNTPLFSVSSSEFNEAQKAFFEAKQELKQARLNLNRQEDLLKHGVGIRQDFEEAGTIFQITKAAYDNTVAALKIYNVNVNQLVLGQPLTVRSPINGEVIENNLVLGQFINDETAPVIKVASLNKIWIAGKIKEIDMQHLAKLHKVMIELSAYPDAPIEGKIFHVNEIVDEETRSIDVLIEVDNSKRCLRPGMYVNVRFVDQPENVILIPTKAVMQAQNSSFVFIKVGDNQFKKQQITIGGVSGDKTVVLSGLKIGDEVVSEGGIYLPQS